MKTQINNLRSGRKNQVLNPKIDYSNLPTATSHNGHAGSSLKSTNDAWKILIHENPNKLKIELFGEVLELGADWSLSGKSVSYEATISREFFTKNIPLDASKNEPYILVSGASNITVHNGKNSFIGICPSLITIL